MEEQLKVLLAKRMEEAETLAKRGSQKRENQLSDSARPVYGAEDGLLQVIHSKADADRFMAELEMLVRLASS